MAVIENCETGDWFAIDLDAREYRHDKRQPCPSETTIRTMMRAAADAKAGRIANRPTDVRYESTTVDTGQTAEILGHVAHHLITTIKETRPDDRVSRTGTSEWIIDAWYADLKLRRPSCLDRCLTRIGMAPGALSPSESIDSRLLTNHTGPVPTGWAVKTITTWRGWTTSDEGKRMESVTTSETDLAVSDAPLDPALFKVPHGFKKVKDLYQHSSREQLGHRTRR